jgi:hypothetical protein
MIGAILEILALILPLIVEALDAKRKVKYTDEEFQSALADGDAAALGALLSARFDRVRHSRP